MINSITLKNNNIFYFDNMKIMGILNTTDDSFYSKSRVLNKDEAVYIAQQMIRDGADILDIGGESTRPGSSPVSAEDEIKRVVPFIKKIRSINKDILISVDTYRAKTAEEAIIAGADIVNDISAMTFDGEMWKVVKKYKVPVILMHMKGKPKDMQNSPEYSNVIEELIEYFKERIKFCETNGISKDKIIIDPGIGFGKEYEHNITLIKNIDIFKKLGCPVLLAASRKSSIGIALGNVPPEDRLEGTIAISCYAALKGVDLVRVHDVKENKRAVKMIEVLK